MSLNACAELVQRGDPDRFRAAMAAPLAARRVLFPLFAFNIEVSRAPWVTQEPMIAEMRLQFWRDVLDEIAAGKPPRAHEVVAPLAAVLGPAEARRLDGLVAARRRDIYRDAFEDGDAFEAYLDATGGHLAWAAARALGAEGAQAESVVRNHAHAVALANYLRAFPELERRGRLPLVDGRPEAIRALAEAGLARLAAARARRRAVPGAATPALIAGWQARGVLRQVVNDPRRVAEGRLGPNPVSDRLALLAASVTGRW